METCNITTWTPYLQYTGLFIFLGIWSMIWKAIALWKAARAQSKPWFIVLLLVNTLGILEILYIFVFAPKKYK